MIYIIFLYYTLRQTRLIQVFGRLWNKRPRFFKQSKLIFSVRLHALRASFIPSHVCTADFDTLVFLHKSYSLSEVGWDNHRVPLLWRYNLHYFSCLKSKYAINQDDKKVALVRQWMAENPFGKGTAYMPYPSSLRIVNWVKWIWESRIQEPDIHLSLWNQLRWLSDRPEYHVLGNHLFSNAKALIFGAVFFGGSESQKWLRQAISILNKELDEQFQSDGSQFELSPMYHALAMEDLLDIYNLEPTLSKFIDLTKIRTKIEDGLSWLEDFTYSNGEYAHFNDSANGVAPTLSQLKDYAERLGIEYAHPSDKTLWVHPDSGHVIFRDLKLHFIADVGKAGPDYLMAHAHADTLSFELAWKGKRLIVNSGTSLYENSPERHRQRSTAAHTTVVINDQNSSEVWHSFRVARRAYPFGLDLSQENPEQFHVTCSHDGYKRLKGKPIHRRDWFYASGRFIVKDTVIGKFDIARARYHLHPDIHAKIVNNKIQFYDGDNLLAVCFAQSEVSEIIPAILSTTYHPEFGLSIDNLVIECIIPENGQLEFILDFIACEFN